MRLFRIGVIVLFVFSVIFSTAVQFKHESEKNEDKPVIINDVGTLELSVNEPADAIFRGLQATDETDGDLTDQILVASISHFLEPGTVNVKYVVFDSHNNAASLTRRVHYTDYESPKFEMDKAPMYMVGSPCDILDHIKVNDCLDGEISDRIRVITNMVNNYAEGVYPILLEVSNSCGDTAQLQLWVHYTRQEQNVNIQLHEYVVYHPQGEKFDPYVYIASVTDENLQALEAQDVTIQANLDENKPGAYQIIYKYAKDNLVGKTAITVIITEKEA